MNQLQEMIEEKYRNISKLNENLMRFTIPIRARAVELLDLHEGSSVLDIGCGTGASFEFILNKIGNSGKITGIDASESMIRVAVDRVKKSNWGNIELQCTLAENMVCAQEHDGALLFAMHDVFNSEAAVIKIKDSLKPGALVVCVGPKKNRKLPVRLLNPILGLLFRRMAISQANQFEPWTIPEKHFSRVDLIDIKHGLLFIYVGQKQE